MVTSSPATGAPGLDLASYLSRIGLAGPLAADEPSLSRLIAHHAQAIPFENLDAIAGRCCALDAAALQDKMVARARGGYCFEHNSLLQHVLIALGFDVQPREARVLTAQPDIALTTRTHMMLQVLLEGRPMLVDVGFGALAPLAPVPFGSDDLRCDDGRVYRLRRVPGGDLLSFEGDEGWRPAYLIEPTRPGPADLTMAHWYASTHPGFFLRRNLSLGRAVPGGRLSLFNRVLTLRLAEAAAPEQTLLQTRAEVADALRDGFGLQVEDDDLDRVMALLQGLDEAAP